MTKSKSVILCSAATALLSGIILTSSGRVPASALSYGVGAPSPDRSLRALTLSLPSFPTDLGMEEDRSEETEETCSDGTASVPVFGEADYTVTVPSAPSKAEKIVKKTYTSSLSINNKTSKSMSITDLLSRVPDVDLSGDGPQILIVHTHTSESYNETGQGWYTTQSTRTTDPTRNMVRMGEILEETLTEAGYGVIHCQVIHDDEYTESYPTCRKSVEECLKKFPSISMIIDLHRDSLLDDGGTKYRPVTEINGVPTAQVMLLMGTGKSTAPQPHWEKNLCLAAWIQREGCERYPGFLRPILVQALQYNQDISNGAILVELGACGNSPAEAEAAARLFGEICARALDRIKEAQS